MAGLISGEDIQKILHSTGPIIKCVLLRTADNDDDAKKPAAKEEGEKIILKHLIDEIEVDTTPKKSMVQQVLGGPITFLGQYEDEGLVLVCRRPETLDSSVGWNPHKLQPPFQDTQVQGNILVMRVADEEEKMEHEEDGSDKPVVNTNDNFFLDFTKDDYIQFALRDDVEPPQFEEQEEEEGGEEDGEENDGDEDEDEEEIVAEDDDDEGEDDEEAQVAMMNLIMGQVLKQFHEENGRGPDTRELLELRSALAQKIGVTVPEVEGVDDDADDGDAKPSPSTKRNAEDEGKDEEGDGSDDHEAKRVKFSQEATAAEDEPEQGEI